VVAGNLVVGLVVFLILTIVNFMVITKGSERVAEVSARFSLDSMPGKQMSIDSDMRAGQIELDEAKRRRNRLEKESQLYGAMDGAMKFVKGDAIAGLIIIAVNMIGGVAIGMMQRGMSFGEDGYALFAAPQQQGAVYFVGAYDRRGRPHCVIVEAFNGVILQAFAYRGDKILLVNRHTPGPGFPGYPHFPDGRFAAGFCPPPPTI
jgi:FHIPEP family